MRLSAGRNCEEHKQELRSTFLINRINPPDISFPAAQTNKGFRLILREYSSLRHELITLVKLVYYYTRIRLSCQYKNRPVQAIGTRKRSRPCTLPEITENSEKIIWVKTEKPGIPPGFSSDEWKRRLYGYLSNYWNKSSIASIVFDSGQHSHGKVDSKNHGVYFPISSPDTRPADWNRLLLFSEKHTDGYAFPASIIYFCDCYLSIRTAVVPLGFKLVPAIM